MAVSYVSAPGPGLLLAPQALARLREAIQGESEHELCGCLMGTGQGPTWRVVDVSVGRNLASSPARRFELDPGHVVRTNTRARALGQRLLGFWHSHPSTGAEPSPHDRHMTWGDWPALIVARGEGEPELRAWRRRASGGWDELPVWIRTN